MTEVLGNDEGTARGRGVLLEEGGYSWINGGYCSMERALVNEWVLMDEGVLLHVQGTGQ